VVPSEGTVSQVHLHFRCDGIGDWVRKFANLAGRHVYEAELGPFDPGVSTVEYCASATVMGEEDTLSAPLEVPRQVYRLNVIPG
jgi:hypothetical protein